MVNTGQYWRLYSTFHGSRFWRASRFVKGCAGFGVVARHKDVKTGRNKARVCAGNVQACVDFIR